MLFDKLINALAWTAMGGFCAAIYAFFAGQAGLAIFLLIGATILDGIVVSYGIWQTYKDRLQNL